MNITIDPLTGNLILWALLHMANIAIGKDFFENWFNLFLYLLGFILAAARNAYNDCDDLYAFIDTWNVYNGVMYLYIFLFWFKPEDNEEEQDDKRVPLLKPEDV